MRFLSIYNFTDDSNEGFPSFRYQFKCHKTARLKQTLLNIFLFLLPFDPPKNLRKPTLREKRPPTLFENQARQKISWKDLKIKTLPVHMSLSAIYIFPGSVHIFSCSRIGRPIIGKYNSLTDAWMWKFELRPPQFLFWEYLFRIFGIVSLQCRQTSRSNGLHDEMFSRITLL